MSYESDRSGQPLPGDSDSQNRAHKNGRDEQSSWLLDGDNTPHASQSGPSGAQADGQGTNWLLDGEVAAEPSLVVTQDTDGDSWLMNVDDPTVTLDVDEAGSDQGFSASYCEPESTASVFGKLLVPAVFVGVFGVGGLLVWRSMSGLGEVPGDAGNGGVVLEPSMRFEGEKLAGPSFETPSRPSNRADGSVRGSIQRDGSVKKSPSGLRASVGGGQFGFTPSSQGKSEFEPSSHAVDTAAQASIAPSLEGTELGSTVEPVQPNPAEVQSTQETGETAPTLVDAIQADETGTYGSGFMTLILHATEFETLGEDAFELYEVQPSTGSLLSFGSFFPITVSEQMIADWGFTPETEVVLESAVAQIDDLESTRADQPVESLLTSQQEEWLAQAGEEDSMELAFVWEEDTVDDETWTTGLTAHSETEESYTAQENTTQPTMDSEWSDGFVESLQAMGTAPEFEGAAGNFEGFEVSSLDSKLESEVEGLPEGQTSLDDPQTGVDEPLVSALPVSSGMDSNGDWLVGEGYVAPEAQEEEGTVADSFDSQDVPVEVLFDSGDLARLDTDTLKNSVGTDLEQGTVTKIEDLQSEALELDTQEMERVMAETPSSFDWVDPLAEFSTGTTPWEPIRQDSESLDSGEEWVAYDEAPFEMPLLVDDAMDSEEQGALADDSDDTSDDSMLDSGEWILLDELESSATAAETVDAEVPDYDALEEFPWVMEENPTALDSTSDPEVESTQGETEEAPLEGDGWYVEASPSEQELDLEGTPSELAEPTMPGDSQEPVTVMETPVAVGPLEVMEAQPAFDEATNGNVDEAMPMDLANGDESVEPATNLNEAMGVSSEPTEGPMEPLAEGTTEDEFEAPEGRNLLDMYSDWNQAENEGQLQTMSTSMWMNFSIGDGAALPFRVAQAGLHSREESGETQPEPVVEETTTQTAPVGILKRRKADGDHWQGKEVPMHAMANKKILLTPKVGPVRVIAKDGETIEGRLHGIGQNYVWLNTNLGRLSVPSRRVERVERLDPNQYSAEVKSVQDYTKLPKVRVRMKGGVITGYELAREGNRITIRTEKGHKMTLVSDDIQSATSHKATGIKRRIE